MQKSEPYKQFGRIVKKRLIDLGMSQRELAKRVGVNENYLTDVLNGRKPGFKYRGAIISVLNMDRDGKTLKREE